MPLDLVGAAEEMHRLEELLENGLNALKSFAHAYANAERDYRLAKAQCWVTTPRYRTVAGKNGAPAEEKITNFDRQAQVEAETADMRMARDLAQDMKQAALESVRSRRAQISAWQSLLNAEKEEFGMARYGPQST